MPEKVESERVFVVKAYAMSGNRRFVLDTNAVVSLLAGNRHEGVSKCVKPLKKQCHPADGWSGKNRSGANHNRTYGDNQGSRLFTRNHVATD